MRKQTDLSKVKQTARSLLLTDIHETEFSPVIVSHPFTDSSFVATPNIDGDIGLLNIIESDADQSDGESIWASLSTEPKVPTKYI